jgi:hypothetical protein
MIYEFVSDEERSKITKRLWAMDPTNHPLGDELFAEAHDCNRLLNRAAETIEQDGCEIKKLQDEQREAIAIDIEKGRIP